MSEKRHQRLSAALCEAVEFGEPQRIRIGDEGLSELKASLTPTSLHKLDIASMRFENVPLSVERGFAGCVVEHDSRYSGPSYEDFPTAIADTVVVMRDSRKPAIVAW